MAGTADKRMSFGGAVSLGVGAMIGAGIFALMGEAGAVAGGAVWISFLIAGLIALVSGYSLGRLAARFPSAGGMAEYLIHGYRSPVVAGAMNVLLYIAALISLALVSKTFGAYATALLPGAPPAWVPAAFTVGVIALFVGINLAGAAKVARIELVIVLVKFVVLAALGIGTLTVFNPALLAPATYPSTGSILGSIAITFFAYEGFRMITNAAEDVENPARTIPRAITTSLLAVMALYVFLAIAVFGALTQQQVVDAKEYALAEAARPVFGDVGFTVVAVTALIATASAINAGLFAATNVSYRMSTAGELPGAFGTPVRRSREGLLISGLLVAFGAAVLDLSQIAILGAASILVVQAATHRGHLRLIAETRARAGWVWTALIVTLAAAAFTLVKAGLGAPEIPAIFAVLVGGAFAVEVTMRARGRADLKPRVKRAKS